MIRTMRKVQMAAGATDISDGLQAARGFCVQAVRFIATYVCMVKSFKRGE